MAVYTHVPAEEMAAFLARYDCGELVSAKGIAEGVENSNYLVDTTADRFILTLYEKRVAADDLPFFMALLDHLAAKGLPVPPAIKDRDGVAIQTLGGRPACLIAFLPGISLSHPTPGPGDGDGAGDGRDAPRGRGFRARPREQHGHRPLAPLFARCGRDLDTIAPGLHDALGAQLDASAAAGPPATRCRAA